MGGKRTEPRPLALIALARIDVDPIARGEVYAASLLTIRRHRRHQQVAPQQLLVAHLAHVGIVGIIVDQRRHHGLAVEVGPVGQAVHVGNQRISATHVVQVAGHVAHAVGSRLPAVAQIQSVRASGNVKRQPVGQPDCVQLV